jgi:DNA-directed RNA polymerase specialized sigma24 family protein
LSEKDDTIRHEISAAERLRFEEMLLRQDTATALRVAVGYAFKRTKSKVMARHLANDAFTLVWERCSWDPGKGPALPVLLCGIIRSELNHEKESGETREEHEQESLADPGTSPDVIPTPEALALAVEEKREDDAAAAADQEWLRSAFEKAGDEVNLLWLRLALEGVPHDDPAAMAKAASRDVNDFYRAQERRKRHLKRMLTLDRGRRDDEEENG